MVGIILFILTSSLTYGCYQDDHYIDIRSNKALLESAHIANHFYGVPISYSHKKLACLPKTTSKENKPLKTIPYTQWYSKDRIKMIQKDWEHISKIAQPLNLKTPLSVLVAIACVETNLGRFLGNTPTLVALANIVAETRPQYQHRLHEYMKGELAALLNIGYTKQIDIDQLKGSWDGGIGIAQFMPSSYLNYAKGSSSPPNLFVMTDALTSMDHYLQQKGKWQNGGKLAQQVNLSKEQIRYFEQHIAPFEQQTILITRAKCDPTLCPTTPSALFIYKTTLNNQDQYWATYPNFEAIRSYNPRVEYALGVTLLSQNQDQYDT